MIKRSVIPWEEFQCPVCKLWAKDWLLLSAGDFKADKYNMMTVGWGTIGILWRKPCAMILVRPQRFTLPILEEFPTFTLTAFPESHRKALNFCGTESGRDHPRKAQDAGLTPIAADVVGAPSYEEAELVLECVKTYRTDMLESEILKEMIPAEFYPEKDYHRIFFGEIVNISGTEKYRMQPEGKQA